MYKLCEYENGIYAMTEEGSFFLLCEDLDVYESAKFVYDVHDMDFEELKKFSNAQCVNPLNAWDYLTLDSFDVRDFEFVAGNLLAMFKAEHKDWGFDDVWEWDEDNEWWCTEVKIEGKRFWAVCYGDDLASGNGWWTIHSEA